MGHLQRSLSTPDDSNSVQWKAFWTETVSGIPSIPDQKKETPVQESATEEQPLSVVKTEKIDETALIDVDAVLQDLFVQTELSLKGSKFAATKLTKQERTNPFKTLFKFKFDLKAANEELKGLKSGVKDRSVALQEANANLDKQNKRLNRELQVRFI